MEARYFEILKTFAGTGGAERGSCGQSDVEGPSHRGAVDAALWPSIRADIVFWGILTELGGAYVVEPYLTLTPISRERNVQPQLLEAEFELDGQTVDLSLAPWRSYFDLKPFSIPGEVVSAHADLERGLPIYAAPDDAEPVSWMNVPLHFERITDRADYVRFADARHGWIRFPQLPRSDMAMIDYGRGLIDVLRGDWTDAEAIFRAIAGRDDIPTRFWSARTSTSG